MNDIKKFINLSKFENIQDNFKAAKPFNHIVIDNFLTEEIATIVTNEIPDYNDDLWHQYNNPIEIKKVCNDWNRFPKNTYNLFSILNSKEFTEIS
jgi:hypothetical protein